MKDYFMETSAIYVILTSYRKECEQLYLIAQRLLNFPTMYENSSNPFTENEKHFVLAKVYEGAFALVCEDYLKVIVNIRRNDDYEYCMKGIFEEAFFSEDNEENDYFIQQAKVLCEEHNIEFDINQYQKKLVELMFLYKKIINKEISDCFRDLGKIMKFWTLIFELNGPGVEPCGNKMFLNLLDFLESNYSRIQQQDKQRR